MDQLIAEAMKKAAVAWLSVADRAPYPVWCLWFDEALLVVSGPAEQPAPGLAQASSAAVTARGDHGGRIVTWRAEVRRVTPGTPEWDVVATQLAGKRLNSLPAGALAARWARDCVICRLTPTEQSLVDLPDTSLAAVPMPMPTPALRRTRQPPA